MGAKMPPKSLQKQPKRSCFSPCLQVFGAKCSREPPRTPKTAQLGVKRAPKSSLILIQFWMISDEMLKDFLSCFAFFYHSFPLPCFALRCFTGSTTNQPHYRNNASTQQPRDQNKNSIHQAHHQNNATTSKTHYQNNASTRQPHFRNNVSLPARWRVMRSTWVLDINNNMNLNIHKNIKIHNYINMIV